MARLRWWVAGLLAVVAVVPAGRAPAAPAAPISWQACTGAGAAGYDCARYAVPLDHARPGAGTVELALMRRRAGDPAHRLGSLFFDPGGPGVSGLSFPTRAADLLPTAVLQRYDVIGFDPRGVGASTPVRCFTTQEQAEQVFGRMTLVPVGAELATTLDADRDYAAACGRTAGPLLAHLATADVARDLDLLRAAVGDRRLNYVGQSYGTLIGATYANLFPDRVGRFVLDGNVDPALRTSDGLEYGRQRAAGYERVLDAVLAECAAVGPARCAFAAGDPAAKFAELRDRLHRGPLALPAGGSLTLSSFTTAVVNGLGTVDRVAPLMAGLQGWYRVLHPTAPAGSARVTPATPYTWDDSYSGVNCLDEPVPPDPDRYPAIARAWERESPTFGRYQAFDEPACAAWPVPGTDRYSGPWNRPTAPILLLGNVLDPATSYAFNLRMRAELADATLVTTDTVGHTVLGRSACVADLTAAYLLTGAVPAGGTRCQPDQRPFPA